MVWMQKGCPLKYQHDGKKRKKKKTLNEHFTGTNQFPEEMWNGS